MILTFSKYWYEGNTRLDKPLYYGFMLKYSQPLKFCMVVRTLTQKVLFSLQNILIRANPQRTREPRRFDCTIYGIASSIFVLDRVKQRVQLRYWPTLLFLLFVLEGPFFASLLARKRPHLSFVKRAIRQFPVISFGCECLSPRHSTSTNSSDSQYLVRLKKNIILRFLLNVSLSV